MSLNREAFKALRERTGHTYSSLAREAGVSRTLILRLENGERNCTPAMMAKLAAALHVPTTALMGPDDGETA